MPTEQEIDQLLARGERFVANAARFIDCVDGCDRSAGLIADVRDRAQYAGETYGKLLELAVVSSIKVVTSELNTRARSEANAINVRVMQALCREYDRRRQLN